MTENHGLIYRPLPVTFCGESTFEVFLISDIVKNNQGWPNICFSSTLFKMKTNSRVCFFFKL